MAHGGGSTMGSKIWAIILVVVVIGVGVYIFNSGLLGKSASGLGSLFSSSTSTSSFGLTPPGFGAPTGPATPGGTTIISPPQSTTTISNPGVNPYDIPSGFTAAQLSPYFEEVLLGSVYAGYDGSTGEITLYTNVNADETIDVTGWKIKANEGSEFIPQAVGLYDPSGFTPPSDIRLGSGQTLILYSSPGTINLRLNECIGYMQKDLNTNPQLPLDCPSITPAQMSSFSGSCQNYIETLPLCSLPNNSSPEIPQNDYACQQFLSTINYKGCFDTHESDPNFLSDQWWAWTGSNILDPYHDVVDLYDRNGLLVDQYTY